MKINKDEVGSRIKEIRLSRGETTEVFGKNFDPHANRSLVSAWENGRYLPNTERLKKVAELGSVSVQELIYGTIETYVSSIIIDFCKENKLVLQKDRLTNTVDFFSNLEEYPNPEVVIYQYNSYPLAVSDLSFYFNELDRIINTLESFKQKNSNGESLADDEILSVHKLSDAFVDIFNEVYNVVDEMEINLNQKKKRFKDLEKHIFE